MLQVLRKVGIVVLIFTAVSLFSVTVTAVAVEIEQLSAQAETMDLIDSSNIPVPQGTVAPSAPRFNPYTPISDQQYVENLYRMGALALCLGILGLILVARRTRKRKKAEIHRSSDYTID